MANDPNQQQVDLAAALNGNQQAIQGLLAYLQQLNQNQNQAQRNPQYDLFNHSNPFDLSTKFGLAAFEKACEPLDSKWDGSPETFPSFLIAMEEKAAECNWNATDDSGITDVPVGNSTKNIFREYHSITEAEINAHWQTINSANGNVRARQNSEAFFKCAKASITGELKITVFETQGNAPTSNYGGGLWHRVTNTTTLSSLQLSIKATSEILTYDPSVAAYCIPTINKQMMNNFILATTAQRKILDLEMIQHVLTVYLKIKQPVEWWNWVQTQQDDFRKGLITKVKNLFNLAVMKYTEIRDEDPESKFRGSLTTVQEDIVVMTAEIAAKAASTNTASKRKRNNTSKESTDNSNKPPPFVRFHKTSNKPDATFFKPGETRTHNGDTWYFCGCPLHKEGIKWHKHKTTDCNVLKIYLKQVDMSLDDYLAGKKAPPLPPPTAASRQPPPIAAAVEVSPTEKSPDVQSLLAAAYSQASAQDSVGAALIADAMEHINNL